MMIEWWWLVVEAAIFFVYVIGLARHAYSSGIWDAHFNQAKARAYMKKRGITLSSNIVDRYRENAR